MKIAMKIKKLREQNGMTQVSLSKKAGLSLAAIEKIGGEEAGPYS